MSKPYPYAQVVSLYVQIVSIGTPSRILRYQIVSLGTSTASSEPKPHLRSPGHIHINLGYILRSLNRILRNLNRIFKT